MKLMTTEQQTKNELLIEIGASAILSTAIVAMAAVMTSPYSQNVIELISRV